MRNTKRWFGLLITACMLVSMVHVNAFAATLTDIDGHWAQATIQSLADDGIISGMGDGTFQPDGSITRAQYFTMINKVFGFTDEADISFNDVNASEWYAPQISRAVAAGYLTGYEDNTARPNANITRAEVSVILTKLLGLPEASGVADQFTDASAIPGWALAYVEAATNAGLMNGFTDGSFRANENLTRAQAATLTYRIQEKLLNAGTDTPKADNKLVIRDKNYGPENGVEKIDKDVEIVNDGTTLRNVVIAGDLTISKTVGDGTVTLENVTVEGTTKINGGGANSIVAKDCVLVTVIIDRESGTVRLLLTGASNVVNTYIHSAAKLEEKDLTSNGFSAVTIEQTDKSAKVDLSGNFESVAVKSAEIVLTLSSGSIDSLEVSKEAAGSKVEVSKNAVVANALIEAIVTMIGEGKIENTAIMVVGVKTDGSLQISYTDDSANKAATETPSTSGGGGGSGSGSGSGNGNSTNDDAAKKAALKKVKDDAIYAAIDKDNSQYTTENGTNLVTVTGTNKKVRAMNIATTLLSDTEIVNITYKGVPYTKDNILGLADKLLSELDKEETTVNFTVTYTGGGVTIDVLYYIKVVK